MNVWKDFSKNVSCSFAKNREKFEIIKMPNSKSG